MGRLRTTAVEGVSSIHMGPGSKPTTRKWTKHITLHCLKGEGRGKRGCSVVNNTSCSYRRLRCGSQRPHSTSLSWTVCNSCYSISNPLFFFPPVHRHTLKQNTPVHTRRLTHTHTFFKDEENDNPICKYENHNINKIPKLNKMGNAIGNDLPSYPNLRQKT